MKNALIALLLLSGCSTTVPVTVKFPAVPLELMETCTELKTLSDEAKLSDVAKSVVNNYTLYYQCAVKVDAWIEWHESQTKIFKEVK
jgi:hypothetical protein